MNNLIDRVVACLQCKKKPIIVAKPGMPDDEIFQDANAFSGRGWEDVDLNFFQNHLDCFAGFASYAYCYFCLALIYRSLRENSFNNLCIDSIFNMLNTSCDPEIWTDFMIYAVSDFNLSDLHVLQEWTDLARESGYFYNEVDFERIYLTIQILIDKLSEN